MRSHPSFAQAPNIGFDLGYQLVAVGCDCYERLCDLGAREVWLRLRVQFPERNSLKTLLALHGAIEQVTVARMPPDMAADLRGWRERHLAGEDAGYRPD